MQLPLLYSLFYSTELGSSVQEWEMDLQGMSGTIKTAAAEYWKLGCNIVLLRDKKPLHEWAKWQAERQTEHEFNSLPWSAATQYGVICGTKLESGLFLGVYDHDVKNLPEDIVQKGKQVLKQLPITQREETPSGGLHLIFYCHAEPKSVSAFHNECALELIGKGKLCIIAPSEGYRNLNDNTPTEVQDLESLLYESISKAQIDVKGRNHAHDVWFGRKDLAARAYRKDDPACIRQIKKGVSEGMRNEAAVRLSSYLVNFRQLAPKRAFQELRFSNSLNKPPLPQNELRNVFESTVKGVYNYGCEDSILKSFCEENVECPIRKNKERKLGSVEVSSGQPAQKEPVPLEHLTMIENPAVADLPIIVEGVVSSTSISYLVPRTLQVFVTDEDGIEDSRMIEIGERNPVNIKFVGVNEDIKFKRLKRFVEEAVNEPGSRLRIEEREWRTIYKIRVRPPVFTLEKREGKIVDEKGYEYKSYDIYVCADEPITFEASSLIRLKGIVLPNPHSQNTTLLVYKVEFPEEFCSFDMQRLDKLKGRFKNLTVQQCVDWILSNFEKFSQIIGRTNLALEGFLAFFTPTYIQLNGKVERGWGNVADVGDTTTGKSETVKKLILLLRAGVLITAETASAVGLVGTATQSDKGQWTVDWGFLVLNDRKLLAIDGAHKLPFSQWAALAESERSGIVTIAKAAKNSAYARTRQIKIANAVDREQDKFCTKSMKEFLYHIQTLSTVFDKTGIARLDLAVFADSRDVKAEDVNRLLDSNYDEDLDLLAEALRWCWSNTAKVEFTPEAAEKILSSATNLYQRFFADSVPLASIDVKWKLARLSAALAFMTISSEDYKTVTATVEHVEAVVAFIEREYSNSSLNTLAQEDKHEVIAQNDVDVFIANVVYRVGIDRDEVVEILKFIVLQGRVTKDQLKSKFGLVENNQARPLLAFLESEKLLRGGKGYYPTARLIEAYKILTRLTRLTCPEKDSPANDTPNNHDLQETSREIAGPSLSESVKDVKRVKEHAIEERRFEPLEDKLVQKLRQELSPLRGYSLERVRSMLQQEGLSEQDSEKKISEWEAARVIGIDDLKNVFLVRKEDDHG